MKNCIITASGKEIDFLNPISADISINDIAFALSHLCRYTGHTAEFYSVAQHSLLVSYAVPEEYALQGLLHDAAEAYLGDVSSPLKSLLPDYQAIEKKLEKLIWTTFGLNDELHQSVKDADMLLLRSEAKDLLKLKQERRWELFGHGETLPFKIIPMDPLDARTLFINRFKKITSLALVH